MKNILIAAVLAACAVITLTSSVPVITKVIVVPACVYGAYTMLSPMIKK